MQISSPSRCELSLMRRCRQRERPAPSHADVRVHRVLTQSIRLRDGVVQAVSDGDEIGVAVPCDRRRHVGIRLARRGVPRCRCCAGTPSGRGSRRHCARSNRDPVTLADEPVYADATWVSPYLEDPFATPTAEKVGLLVDYSGRLQAADGVDHVTASVLQVKEQTFYADLAGSSITQQRVRLHPPSSRPLPSTSRPAASNRCVPWRRR